MVIRTITTILIRWRGYEGYKSYFSKSHTALHVHDRASYSRICGKNGKLHDATTVCLSFPLPRPLHQSHCHCYSQDQRTHQKRVSNRVRSIVRWQSMISSKTTLCENQKCVQVVAFLYQGMAWLTMPEIRPLGFNFCVGRFERIRYKLYAVAKSLHW